MLAADQQAGSTRVMIWIVKGPPAASEIAGLLQQAYVADPTAPADRVPIPIGGSSDSILWQPFADSQPSNTAADSRSRTISASRAQMLQSLRRVHLRKFVLQR